MLNRTILIFGLFFVISSIGVSQINERIPVLDFKGLQPYLYAESDTVYIVNFWATWCVPCRKEIPEIQKTDSFYAGQKVKFLLVSLDFVSQIDKILIPYIQSKHIKPQVIVLNDPNSNEWIEKVDASWSGSLPATVIYSGRHRLFFEKELDFDFLRKTIDTMLKP